MKKHTLGFRKVPPPAKSRNDKELLFLVESIHRANDMIAVKIRTWRQERALSRAKEIAPPHFRARQRKDQLSAGLAAAGAPPRD